MFFPPSPAPPHSPSPGWFPGVCPLACPLLCPLVCPLGCAHYFSANNNFSKLQGVRLWARPREAPGKITGHTSAGTVRKLLGTPPGVPTNFLGVSSLLETGHICVDTAWGVAKGTGVRDKNRSYVSLKLIILSKSTKHAVAICNAHLCLSLSQPLSSLSLSMPPRTA